VVAAIIVPVSDETALVEIPADDPTAVELVLAVHGGDIDTIRRLLAENSGLARAGLVGRKGGFRTPLHLVADWPGYFPSGPQIVHLLIQAGADPATAIPPGATRQRCTGRPAVTMLTWPPP
jgi:Ankyrin repeat